MAIGDPAVARGKFHPGTRCYHSTSQLPTILIGALLPRKRLLTGSKYFPEPCQFLVLLSAIPSRAGLNYLFGELPQ